MKETGTLLPAIGPGVSKSHCTKDSRGMFININMARRTEDHVTHSPSEHDVYLLAAMLESQFGLNWVAMDINQSSEEAQRRLRAQRVDRLGTNKHTRPILIILQPIICRFGP